MRYRALDINGDYSFGHGQSDLLINTPATVAQAIKTRLLLFTNEWFLDLSDGTAWLTQVLGKGTIGILDRILQDRILGTQGVLGITFYDSIVDSVHRHLTVNLTVDTIYGKAFDQFQINFGPINTSILDVFELDVTPLGIGGSGLGLTTYPLPTLAPVIDVNGITAPAYTDIFASLQASMQVIFGSDLYLDADSQDGQMLAIFAAAQKDLNDSVIATYNSFSPATAVGNGLSSVVKINGLRRVVATNSTVILTIIGTAGTSINIPNGTVIVGDDQNLNSRWRIDTSSPIVIPTTGTIDVSAISLDPGNVTAAPNTLTSILTPISGWQTVTNNNPAIPGIAVETDATLRQRQSISTGLPAETPLDSILAAVANVPSVGRSTIYENDTAVTDSLGIPSHSIAVVAEGGNPVDIATAIAFKKSPGTGTFGDITEVIIDPEGIPNTIHFFGLTEIHVSVIIQLKALPGYVSSIGNFIQSAVAAYLNSLTIGEQSYLSKLWSPANLAGDAATSSTGFSQAQLDNYSNTYNLLTIYQATDDDVSTGGPYTAGATAITLTDADNFSNGQQIAIELDNTLPWFVTISTVVGDVINFSPAIPAGRSVQNGALVYVFGDVKILFNQATTCQTTDILIQVS